jgi:hypothetical protein
MWGMARARPAKKKKKVTKHRVSLQLTLISKLKIIVHFHLRLHNPAICKADAGGGV